MKYTPEQIEILSGLRVVNRIKGFPIFDGDGEAVCFCPHTGVKVLFVGSGLSGRSEAIVETLISGKWIDNFKGLPDSLDRSINPNIILDDSDKTKI